MRRALKRGRVATILLVATAGYLLGNWHAISLRSADSSPGLSPAQSVALRFPEVQADAAVTDTVSAARSAISPTSPTSGVVFGGAQLALLSPEPMVGRGRCAARAVVRSAGGTAAARRHRNKVAAGNAPPQRAQVADGERRSPSQPAGLRAQRCADRQHQGAAASDARPGTHVAVRRSGAAQHRLRQSPRREPPRRGRGGGCRSIPTATKCRISSPRPFPCS